MAAVGDTEAEHRRPRKLRKLVKGNTTDCRTKRPLIEGLGSLGGGEKAAPGSCSNRAESPSYTVGRPSGDALKFGHVSPLGGPVELAPADIPHSGGRQGRKAVIRSAMDSRNKEPVIVDLESLDRNELGAFGLRSKKTGDRRKRPSTSALEMLEPASQKTEDEKTKGRSSQSTDGADGERQTSKNTQSSQSSQPTSLDREIMCAICLAEAKSASEGLLGCGHDFCFTCISKWTNEAVPATILSFSTSSLMSFVGGLFWDRLKASGYGGFGDKLLTCWHWQKNESTCPLCKAPFDIITKQELDAEGNIKETLVAIGKKARPLAPSSSRSIGLVSLHQVGAYCECL